MTVPNKLTRGAVITKELKAEIERRYNEFDSVQQQLAAMIAERDELIGDILRCHDDKMSAIAKGDEAQKREMMLRDTLKRIANRFDLGNGKCAGAAEQHTYDEAMRTLADTEIKL